MFFVPSSLVLGLFLAVIIKAVRIGGKYINYLFISFYFSMVVCILLGLVLTGSSG